MKQIGIVFQFEFLNYLKRKSFLALTLVLIVAVALVLSWGRITEVFKSSDIDELTLTDDVKITQIALVDRADGQGGNADYYNDAYSSLNINLTDLDISEKDLKKAVEKGDYDFALILTGPLSYTRLVRNLGLYDEFSYLFDDLMLKHYQLNKLQEQGLSLDDANLFLNARVTSDISFVDGGKSQEQSFIYTYVLIFLLYFAILIYGQFVSASVATEKSTRAMELLITSSKPTHFMFGKVLGAGFAGFSQMLLILGTAFVFYNANKSYHVDNYIMQSLFSMPLSILLYTLLFFVLGFFLYAFLYASLASLVNRMEELNTATMPVTMLFIFSFFISMLSMGAGNVDSLLMRVCSYLPLTSPMVMFARVAMGEVAPYELVVSVGLLAASVVGIGVLSAKIYRLGVLMYGTPPKLSNLVKMFKKVK